MTSPTAHRAGTDRRRRLPTARSLLGVLLLAMAAGQVSDVGGFARILETYQAFPGGFPTVAAWAFITTEATAGAALLRSGRWGTALSVAVALAWTVLGTQAFARGLRIGNCGCFGVRLGQPLRWWVLIEDAEFIALTAWVRRAERRATPSPDREPVTSNRPSPPAPAGRRGRIG